MLYLDPLLSWLIYSGRSISTCFIPFSIFLKHLELPTVQHCEPLKDLYVSGHNEVLDMAPGSHCTVPTAYHIPGPGSQKRAQKGKRPTSVHWSFKPYAVQQWGVIWSWKGTCVKHRHFHHPFHPAANLCLCLFYNDHCSFGDFSAFSKVGICLRWCLWGGQHKNMLQ